MTEQLPPASYLHSVLLITKSRSLGPRLVFHYPALSPSAASLATAHAPAWYGNQTSTGSLDSHSSSSDWDSGTDNGGEDDIDTGSKTSNGRGSGRTGASHRDRASGSHRPGAGGAWGRNDNIDEEDSDQGDDETEPGYRKGAGIGKDKGGDSDWNTVLGFKVDALEKMLCPPKSFNKRKFELGVENVVFVGAPMFVREDGQWKKARRRRARSVVENNQPEPQDQAVDDDEGIDVQDHESGRSRAQSFEYPVGYEPGYGHGLVSGAPSGAGSEAGSDTRSNSTTDNTPDMTMFNIVFVLNPPALEYSQRVKHMYDNVTRKFAKVLKYEQARFQYVWKESKKIINIKQRAKENGDLVSVTWREIIEASPLAKSIANLFGAISNDKIAHIYFDATFNTSFQIPQPDSTPKLPGILDMQLPGLWLTTSNVVIDDENNAPLTQHSALLLLEDASTLIKQLEDDMKEDTVLIAFYMRNIVPTKSLYKISVKHNILAQDMEFIARHLVYWRKARLIPPLNPRDTYVVSPNADMSALQGAIQSYASRFPTLPSLPKMLSMLSGTPRPFRTFIPTSEHRDAYMEILAWLLRGGWVTQLRTFAWVRVTPSIKAEVAIDMEREAHMKKLEEDRQARREQEDSDSMSEYSDNKRLSILSTLSSNRPSTPLRRYKREGDDEAMEAGLILSPRQPANRGSPARPASDAGSTSSNRTSIALNMHQTSNRPLSPQTQAKQQKTHRPSPLHLKQPPAAISSPTYPTSPSSLSLPQPISAHDTPTHSPPPDPDSFTPSIILRPQKANSLEARWLEKIGQSFQDKDIRDHWSMLLKYFDGTHALDDISSREGIKRKRVSALIGGVREAGWLVTFRHW